MPGPREGGVLSRRLSDLISYYESQNKTAQNGEICNDGQVCASVPTVAHLAHHGSSCYVHIEEADRIRVIAFRHPYSRLGKTATPGTQVPSACTLLVELELSTTS